jgi:hypothetical protein
MIWNMTIWPASLLDLFAYSLRPWIFAFLPFKFCPKKLHTKTKGCHIRPGFPLGFVTSTACLRKKKQILMYRRGDVVPSPPQVLTDYWRGRSKDQSDFYRSKGIFVISHIVLVCVPRPRSTIIPRWRKYIFVALCSNTGAQLYMAICAARHGHDRHTTYRAMPSLEPKHDTRWT